MIITTASEMKSLDQQATDSYAIPSVLLMENAAFGIVRFLERTYPDLRSARTTILCGRGNNGGDGLAVARHLLRRGVDVVVILLADPDSLRSDARTNLQIYKRSNGPLYLVDTPEALSGFPRLLEQADLLVDAVFGTGLSHPIGGHYAGVIETVNRSGIPVVSVDIPSGIDADTGQILGTAIRAERTVSLALPKRGHFLPPGSDHRGALTVVDIGIPRSLVEACGIGVRLLTAEQIEPLLPARPRSAHKGQFGHLVLLAGARGKMGAASLSARGALRTGVGLLTLAHAQGSPPPEIPPEVMTFPLPETPQGTVGYEGMKPFLGFLEGKRAVALGPGLGQDPETQELIRELIFDLPLPVVVDADGLHALSGRLKDLPRAPAARILTPHPGEMARLLGISVQALSEDRMEAARRLAKEHRVILVLKGAHSLVALPDGRLWVNTTGNPGMATGGSGDVLTGMIGAHLAQGRPPDEAATLSVFLHGLAGDLAAERIGEIGVLPTDLVEAIPQAVRALQQGTVARNPFSLEEQQ